MPDAITEISSIDRITDLLHIQEDVKLIGDAAATVLASIINSGVIAYSESFPASLLGKTKAIFVLNSKPEYEAANVYQMGVLFGRWWYGEL